MDRRNFIKSSALAAAALGVTPYINASNTDEQQLDKADSPTDLIDSAPVLQNYAATSICVVFSVTDMANGFVEYGLKPDLSDAVKVKSGGYRVTDMNSEVVRVRITGLRPATRY